MTEMDILQEIMQEMKSINKKIDSLEKEISGVKLYIENTTNKNLSLLAENHLNLIDKLNENVTAVHKNLLYELKVNIHDEKISQLEKEIAELKSKSA